MKQRHLMTVMSIVALVISSFMIAGNAGAMYMADGSVQNGATGGWKAPTDGICAISIDMSGNMLTDASITTARDCQARLVSATATVVTNCTAAGTPYACCTGAGTGPTCAASNDTLANVCGNPTKNTAGLKYAAPGSSTCVTIDGSGNITGSKSMVNLDRGAVMCNALGGQLANATVGALSNGASITIATKTNANAAAAMCIAYGWQYRGQDATGTPLTFGATGVAQGSGTGYCYASMDWSSVPGYAAATCPSLGATVAPFNANAAYDWSVSGTKCLYAKSVAGTLNSTLTNIDTTIYAAAGTYTDLSSLTTQGACLAHGGSWANWIPGGATALTTLAGTGGNYKMPAWDYTRVTPDADSGCLHCHSYKSQQNGPAERFKDSYLQTGHKNMLRRVIPGMAWAGPTGAIYTQDTAGHAIDFQAGTVGGQPLYYIFGDWIVSAPNAVGPAGDTPLYSCAACHTSGYSDNTNPGVQSIGTPGYTASKPADYLGSYVTSVTPGNKWDLEGINCSRCHNAAVGPVSQTQINASGFKTTAPTSGGMGALANGTGRTNLCFGCHQSIAKNYPAQGGAVGGTTQYDPTLIPTGVSHGAAAGRDFNGHVLGNSFLNSAHARYAGVNNNAANGGITLNSLGKFDLFDPNGTTEYNSLFKGYTCWQSPTSNSPAKTTLVGGQIVEIASKSQCESLYGVGSWRADQDGSLAASSVQGTCTTCHDVHNSLFVSSQAEAAIRKSCEDCHVNNVSSVTGPVTNATDAMAPQVSVASTNHPQGPGTPFDTSMFPYGSCSVCHMATQAQANGNQNSMPVHVWRISTDANYNTFPTVSQFYGGTCSVHSGAVQNAPYLPAVYLSDTSSANCTAAVPTAGTWSSVLQDRNAQTAPETYLDANGNSHTDTKAVWVDLDMACGQCHGGSFGSSQTHNEAPYFTKSYLGMAANNMHYGNNNPPTVASTISATNLTVTLTDNSVDSPYNSPTGFAANAVTVNWGDNVVTTGNVKTALTHTYSSAGTYTIWHSVVDNAGVKAQEILNPLVVPATGTISGRILHSDGVTGFQGAVVYLKQGGSTLRSVNTDATGSYSFSQVPAGSSYTVQPYRIGTMFVPPSATAPSISASPVITTENFTANR